MAEVVDEGVRSVPGTEVTVKRVAETIPATQAAAHGVKLDQKSPVGLLKNWLTATPLSLSLRRVLAIWLGRCELSLTRLRYSGLCG